MGIKDTIFSLTNALGVNAMSRLNNIENIACLMYHGVVPDDDTIIGENWLHVKASEFSKQMEFLQTRFDVLPFNEVAKMLGDGYTPSKMDKPIAVITFDDGYVNNHSIALPILRSFGLPAAIFLVTDTIGKDHVFWYDKILSLNNKVPLKQLEVIVEEIKKKFHPSQMDAAADDYLKVFHKITQLDESTVAAFRTLNRSEIQDLCESGLISFGSHTHKHELLTSLNKDELRETLSQSFEIMSELCDYPTETICYPNGYYSDDIISVAKDIGYINGITTITDFWSSETDPFKIPRIPVGRNTTFNGFKASVSGTIGRLAGITNSVRKLI